ncbi:hypothetical protein K9F62_19765 [Desulfovibrio sp. JY]|nr:hypothetical protein K9F62_19765 [Desulfovibrio sp. JY]
MSFSKKNARPVDLSTLRETLPPILARKKIDRYLGGIISQGYLANLDSEGTGPRRVRVGGTVGYLREDLIAWLEERSSMID